MSRVVSMNAVSLFDKPVYFNHLYLFCFRLMNLLFRFGRVADMARAGITECRMTRQYIFLQPATMTTMRAYSEWERQAKKEDEGRRRTLALAGLLWRCMRSRKATGYGLTGCQRPASLTLVLKPAPAIRVRHSSFLTTFSIPTFTAYSTSPSPFLSNPLLHPR